MTTQSQEPVVNSFSIEQALSQAVAGHQAGRLQEAERLYRAILQVQPQHPVANHNLGVLAVQVKQPAAGLPYFKLALDTNSNQGQYWISYIDALIQSGQINEAQRVLENGRQIGLHGAAVDALAKKLDGPLPEETSDLAALFNQGRYAEGEAMARAMTERFPNHGFGWKVLGAILHKLERPEEALQAKERAALLMPNDAEVHNNIGHSFQELGRFSDAEGSLRRALALNPNYPSACNNLGLTLQKMGRLDEAEVTLRRALALKPDYAEAHNNLGLTLEKKSQLSDAEASYREALKIRPDYAEAYKNLGNIFLNRKMIKEAMVCYENAIAIAPDYDAAHNNLGAAHFASGNIDLAVLCYQKAHELKPLSAGALHNLGSALYQQGNITAAIDCFRKTLAFKHDNWVVDSAAYLTILYYWMDDMPEAMRVIKEFKGEVAKGDAKLGAYFNYLELLVSLKGITRAVVGPPSDEVLYVIGESHAFSLHNVQVVHRGEVKTCHSRWILGCKQWHLGNDHANIYKYKFEAEMAQLPRRSTILLTIGEIDCRPNEGILTAWKKYPGKPLDEVAQATVTGYVRYVARIAAQYGHQMIVGGVPATNIPLNTLTADVAEQLVHLIRAFNAMLKDQALAAGMDFLDVYVLTNRGDGTASGQWHIDDVHLTPSAMVEAFNRCFITANSTFKKKVATLPKSTKHVGLGKKSNSCQGAEVGTNEAGNLAALFSRGLYLEMETAALALTMRFPEQGIGWKGLGVALQMQGRSKEALSALRKAADLLPEDAETQSAFQNVLHVYSNILQAQGRLSEAETCYRQALEAKPDFAEVYANLGNNLQAQGRLSEAEACYRRALEIRPDLVEAHSNLGNSLQAQGRLSEAENSYRLALGIKPDFAEAYYNLGNSYKKQGRILDAEAAYRRALEINPDFVEALGNLALLFNAQGAAAKALSLVCRSLQIREMAETKGIFVSCVKHLRFEGITEPVRNAVVRALSEPWGRPRELASLGADLLKLSPGIGEAVQRAAEVWPRQLPAEELFAPAGLAAVAVDPLLSALLDSAPICSMELERFLTMARRLMLDDATRRAEPSVATLSFYAALARQCFINEYVFSAEDDEVNQAHALRDALSAALQAGVQVPALWPMAVAAYFPLQSVPLADRLLDWPWLEAVTALLVQQVREPKEERHYRDTVVRLTAVDDEVSLLVQNQYEENPYPRWIKAAPVGKPMPLEGMLRSLFPLTSFQPPSKHGATEILIAGCGTGQQPIEVAQRYLDARVLAVDLSLSSLCYAMRKTRELGLTNIEYAQADILKLGSIDRRFDIIQSSGVLHHLADPWAAWRELLSLLRPGGFMHLGFYSEVARRDVVRTRAFIAEQGYGTTAEEIRRCRQDLMRLDENRGFGMLPKLSDFFSISECRDLLFHVQEHRMTLTGIEEFLRENNLQFLGFETDAHVLHAYKLRFTDDRAARNLGNWQIFENENPYTFLGMYQFWVQKAG